MSSYSSTVAGADFTTQNYRHGVLVGNWSEDEFGVQMIRSDPIKQSHYEDTFRTSQRLNYNDNGLNDARKEMYENRFKILKGSIETSKDLIFTHGIQNNNNTNNNSTSNERFQTTYNTLHNGNGFQCSKSAPSGETSLIMELEKKKFLAEEERSRGLRARNYETSSCSTQENVIKQSMNGNIIGAGMNQGGEKCHHRQHIFGRKFESAAETLKLRK